MTAIEFFDNRSKELGFENWTQVIVQQEWEVIELLPIEFTKMHVKEALRKVDKNARIENSKGVKAISFGRNFKGDFESFSICKHSITNAYPISNIK